MLSDIRSELVSDFGFAGSSETDKAYLNKLINDAIDEIYRDNELYLSEREQIFNVGADKQVITLPSEVDKVLAVRRYESRNKVAQEDMRPRYRSMGWAEPYLGYPYLKWRFKNRSCLKREFLNTAPFTYTINQPVTGGFTLTITGKTATASRIVETITFSDTDISKTGTVPFVEYHSIQKNTTTTQDVIVTDADGNEMAVLPNNATKVSYPYYQILDRYESISSGSTLVEVLYKLEQPKLVNDTDSFLDDIYDKAVYWKAAAFYFAKKPGDDSLQRAKAYGQKAEENLAATNESYMRNSTSEVIYAQAAGSKVLNAIKQGVFSPYYRP